MRQDQELCLDFTLDAGLALPLNVLGLPVDQFDVDLGIDDLLPREENGVSRRGRLCVEPLPPQLAFEGLDIFFDFLPLCRDLEIEIAQDGQAVVDLAIDVIRVETRDDP